MSRVYFIKPIGMDGPVKIGCSFSPERRRSSLATWSPFALEIVAEIDGDTTLERRFHAAFISTHQRREWFNASAEISATISAINAGTFDISTLPGPRSVVAFTNGAKNKKPAYFGRQMSYSLRIVAMERRTGFMFGRSVYDMVRDNDVERMAAADAYLANPDRHGVPCANSWAVVRQAQFIASRQPEPQQAAA